MDVQRFALGATTLYVVQMPDRRAAGQPQQRWMLQNQVEVALFGGAGTGAVWRALQRLGMQTCPLSLKRSSIPALVSDAEYKELLTLLESTLDLSCKGRCRAVSLLAVPVAVAVAKSLGRGTLTCAFLSALQQEQPRIWEIQREQEALAERNEVDLLLEDELEVEEEMEAPLLAELIHTHVAFEETKEEQEAVKVYKLDPVPRLVTEQLSAYKDWRLCPLNYQRGSNAVVDITAEHDCSTVQRFLAYAQQEHEMEPTLAIFGSARCADVAQRWLEQMLERGLIFPPHPKTLTCIDFPHINYSNVSADTK